MKNTLFEYTDQYPFVSDHGGKRFGKVVSILKRGVLYRIRWDDGSLQTLKRDEFASRYTTQSPNWEPVLDKKVKGMVR